MFVSWGEGEVRSLCRGGALEGRSILVPAFSCQQFLLPDSSGIQDKSPRNNISKKSNKGPLLQSLIHHTLLLPTGPAGQRGKLRNCRGQLGSAGLGEAVRCLPREAAPSFPPSSSLLPRTPAPPSGRGPAHGQGMAAALGHCCVWPPEYPPCPVR